jgi:LmbE family N-acetylglucosaminyl deacetylase
VLGFNLNHERDKPLHVLCLGAHSDDIEIGCGGTMLRLVAEYPNLVATWVVFSAPGDRAAEAKRSAAEYLENARQKQIAIKDFKDGYFPAGVSAIKDVFEELKADASPDVILTHYRHDLHQDHRQINELTWNTWRDHFILEYEIPKYDGDLGNPNFFVLLDDDFRQKKIDLLMRYFQTQANKEWFATGTFNAIMRLRGVECRSPSGYAEAFYARKSVY